MDFTLYTFGGGEALWKVFNGIALMFKSDSGMNAVMKLSMTVGGVWAAMRAMWGGNVGIFARDYFIPTYLILNLMLIPTTSINIIDEVNPDFHYAKVDHVPMGIAAVASTASHLSKLLTDMLEHSLQPAEANRYGKTGPLFSARLVSMARDLQIAHPVEKENLKGFMRQCYTLPYIWTNIKNKKKEALETQDILGFIASNPHKWLGSYWKDPATNETVFLSCREGSQKAIELLAAESPRSLVTLAAGLFGSKDVDDTLASARLSVYFDDAWQALSHQTRNAHNIAEQAMIMNVYRESVDDHREQFGLSRLNPHLIAASSARAKFQQNSGFLVSAQMVSSMLPSLQSTMLAILCILFVIVIPMSMLPGGLKTLGMWIKLILWVESWPVFYAIINSVALIMASNRGASFVSQGAGLSLLTQNGLADAAYDAYCYAEGFMAVVPVMAWAVISGGGYALANLSGTVTRSVDGLASKLGSEMTDGNLSFDNQNYHNESVANRSMAQQPGLNINWGMTHGDGHFNMTTDTRGDTTIQQAQSSYLDNVSDTHSESTALSKAAQEQETAAYNQSISASESQQKGENLLSSYMENLTKGSGRTDTSGHTDTAGSNKDVREAYDMAKKISKVTGLSEGRVLQLAARGGLDSGFLKAMGINIGSSLSSEANAADREDFSKITDSGLQEQFSKSLSRASQSMKDHKVSTQTNEQRQAADTIQGHFNTAQSHQTQAQASLTNSQNLTKSATMAENRAWAINSNKNDEVVAGVAQQRHGNSGEVAIQETLGWMRDNREAYRQKAAAYMTEKHKPLIEALKSNHNLTEGQIEKVFKDYESRVPGLGDPQSHINHVKEMNNQEGLGDEARANLQKQVERTQEQTDINLGKTEQEVDNKGQVIKNNKTEQEDQYKKESNKGRANRLEHAFGDKSSNTEQTLANTVRGYNSKIPKVTPPEGPVHPSRPKMEQPDDKITFTGNENIASTQQNPSSSLATAQSHSGDQTPVSRSPTPPTIKVTYSEGNSFQGSNIGGYSSYLTATTPVSTVDPNSSQTVPSSNSFNQRSDSPPPKVEINAEGWNPNSSNAEWPSNSPSSSTNPDSGNQTPVSWSPTPTVEVPYSDGSSSQGSNIGGYGGYPASVTPASTVDPNSSTTTPSPQPSSEYPQTSNPSDSVYGQSPTPPSSIVPQAGEVPFVAPPDLHPDPTQAKMRAQARELKELKQSLNTPQVEDAEGSDGLPLPSGPLTK